MTATATANELAAHMRDHHGWTVLDTEETDLFALRAMHRVAAEAHPGGC